MYQRRQNNHWLSRSPLWNQSASNLAHVHMWLMGQNVSHDWHIMISLSFVFFTQRGVQLMQFSQCGYFVRRFDNFTLSCVSRVVLGQDSHDGPSLLPPNMFPSPELENKNNRLSIACWQFRIWFGMHSVDPTNTQKYASFSFLPGSLSLTLGLQWAGTGRPWHAVPVNNTMSWTLWKLCLFQHRIHLRTKYSKYSKQIHFVE